MTEGVGVVEEEEIDRNTGRGDNRGAVRERGKEREREVSEGRGRNKHI